MDGPQKFCFDSQVALSDAKLMIKSDDARAESLELEESRIWGFRCVRFTQNLYVDQPSSTRSEKIFKYSFYGKDL